MKAKLPSFFSFKSANDLVRVGKEYDGGYLVSQSDIDNSDVLIGLGIGDDWSFEEDFIGRRDVEVHAYDASVGQKHFLKQFIKSLIRIDNPKLALHWLKVAYNYTNFFSKTNIHHIKKFVGLNSDNDVHCTLSSILDDIKSQNIFLKIDVEGSEYRFLDTLISNQNRISGLALELHDCDLHLGVIEKFICNFGLELVHIHANNFAPIRSNDGLPLVLELTFSKYCVCQNKAYLPHALDMPNNKKASEINCMIATR